MLQARLVSQSECIHFHRNKHPGETPVAYNLCHTIVQFALPPEGMHDWTFSCLALIGYQTSSPSGNASAILLLAPMERVILVHLFQQPRYR